MSSPTVLLIDYEPASIEQMKGPLQAAGYTVEVVFDGVAGLKAFNEMKPDLVLIEAMIPKKHGFEVCQEIKKTPEGKDTPVVIATSIYKGRKYRNQALKNYGCDEYLEKPVNRDDLLKVCRRYLKEVQAQASGETPQDASPRPAARVDQGLDNLDAMDEREISDKLDQILGAFGEAVDEVREEAETAAPPPPPAPVSDQEVMAELLEEVGNAEPEEFAPQPEPAVVEEPEPEGEPEAEPEPAQDADIGDEVEARVEDMFSGEAAVSPEPEFETGVQDQPVPDEAFEQPVAEPPQQAEPAGGTRFLGLGIPAWIGIAAATAVLVFGGIKFLGGRGETEPVSSPPATDSRVAAERRTPTTPPVYTPPSQTAENDAAGPADREPVETTASPPTVVSEVEPEPVLTPPAKQEPKPVETRPAANQPEPEPTRLAAKYPTKESAPEPAVTRPEPETTPPPADKPAPAMADPVETEPVKTEPAVSRPEPKEIVVETVPEPEPAPVAEPPAEPEPKPVVEEPEPVRLVKARRGELVPLNSVDSPPVQTVNVAPKYHPMARKLRQQGTVLLNLLVDETGAVADVEVVREIPKSTLNQQAVNAARKWAYEPAMKDGVPVKVWLKVSLDFRL